MSMELNAECYLCHLRRNVENARALGDEATATAFARDLMQIYLNAPKGASSPALGPATNALFQKYYGVEEDRFRKEKEESNRFVMARLDRVRHLTETAEDPLLAALQFAVLGNYIDFSALQGQVSFEELDQMLDTARDIQLSEPARQALTEDLRAGKKLLYLTDNAGEICFDRILAEQIHKQFPQLEITFCVRGGPAHNDATREDAAFVGIPFPVIDNGNTVGGTELSLLSPEAKTALEQADVIIAKGQGNIETMLGCGYNVYYLFLVKCSRFQQEFGLPKLTPVLMREKH